MRATPRARLGGCGARLLFCALRAVWERYFWVRTARERSASWIYGYGLRAAGGGMREADEIEINTCMSIRKVKSGGQSIPSRSEEQVGRAQSPPESAHKAIHKNCVPSPSLMPGQQRRAGAIRPAPCTVQPCPFPVHTRLRSYAVCPPTPHLVES